MKKLIFITAAAIMGCAAASAADLPRKAPAYAPPPAPVFSWTGCYIGGNVGYGWGRTQFTDFITVPGFDVGTATGTGVVGGGQVGCDYQTTNWVFGLQGLFDASGVKGSLRPNGAGAAVNPVGFTANETLGFKTDWFTTLTGRVGYLVQPKAMVYLKGGAAWAHISYSDIDPTFVVPYAFYSSATRSGWTVGGGLEYALQGNWFLFAEYNFVDFGSRRIPLGGNSYAYDIKQNLQTVLVGLNYRFGWQ